MVQFIKGAWHTAERDALAKFGDLVSWHAMGEGYLGDAGSRPRRRGGARLGEAQELIADPSFSLVVLDELNIALRYDYLDLNRVLETLAARRADLHVVVTGRNAKPELVEAADLVAEMTLVKHHFAAGVKAQEGSSSESWPRVLMFQGTGSDVGKSLIVAGLARRSSRGLKCCRSSRRTCRTTPP